MSDLKPEEREAASVLRHALAADRVLERDVPGAPDSRHDFDVVAGPLCIAVEVTQAANRALMWRYGELEELRQQIGSNKISVTQTLGRWSVWVEPDTRVKSLVPQLDSLVAAVEADDVWYASHLGGGAARDATQRRMVPTPASVRALAAAGVKHALRWRDTQASPAIDVLPPDMWAWENVDAPAKAVEDEIPRNIDKLRWNGPSSRT